MKRPWALCRTVLVTLVLIQLFAVPAPPTTEAFKLDGAGGHPEITRRALQTLKPVRVDDSALSFSPEAIEQVVDANEMVDYMSVFGISPLFASWHFDDETLPSGSKRLKRLYSQIVDALKQDEPDGSLARDRLGEALHTLQDFFAHSNWVELKERGRAPTIQFGKTELKSPSLFQQFCSRTNPGELVGAGFTDLTTGYFLVDPTLWIPRGVLGKCAHGIGILPGISKDDDGDNSLANNSAHQRQAIAAAEQASQQFVTDILNEKGIAGNAKAIKAFLGVGGSLVFVIDVSSSMSDEINAVKAEVRELIEEAEDEVYRPEEYVLTTFSDPPDRESTFITSDPQAFLAELDGLTVAGGGDCPEFAMTAVSDAIYAGSLGATIFVFTDASAKDSALRGNVERDAQSKGSTVTYLLSGSCSPIDPAYIETAAATGGQVYNLLPSELSSAFDLINPQIQGDVVTLFHTTGALTGAAQKFAVPVDSTISRAIFSLTIEQKQTFTLQSPSGAIIATTTSGVTFTSLRNGWIVSIDRPEVGLWQATLNGVGAYSAIVNASSPIHFYSFDFVERATRRHEGLYPIAGQPIKGTSPVALARILGPSANVQFRMLSRSGADLGPLNLTAQSASATSRGFKGSVPIPAEPFHIVARGADTKGKPFQRLFPTLFTGQPLQLSVMTPRTEQDFRPGSTTTISVTVLKHRPIRYVSSDGERHAWCGLPGGAGHADTRHKYTGHRRDRYWHPAPAEARHSIQYHGRGDQPDTAGGHE